MEIFISWSGPKSHAVALALHGWLPKIVNAFKPWLSSADLDKGTRWSSDVAGRLQLAKAGIICLTPSNLRADWLLFEAGALSKQVENNFVCPLLIGLEPADVKGPLAQFQATRLMKVEVLHLLKTLNRGLADGALSESHIHEAFEVWWPKLETELNNIPTEKAATSRPERSERDLLEEILSLVRNQNRDIQSSAKKIPDAMLQELISEMLRGLDPSLVVLQASSGSGGHHVRIGDSLGREYEFTFQKTATMKYIKDQVSAAMRELAKAVNEVS